jgi:hypothetical protein
MGYPKNPEQSPGFSWDVDGRLFFIAKSGWLNLNSLRLYEQQWQSQ